MSSSSDESGAKPLPPVAAALVTKTRASSPDTSDDEPWMDKVLDAFIHIPADNPEKGVSIVKVKKYLKDKYRTGVRQMREHVYPTLKRALARKYIIKTTALNSVALGSARLNPACEITRLQHNKEDDAMTEDEKVGTGGGRKRKAASADEDGSKGNKRRVAPGKAN